MSAGFTPGPWAASLTDVPYAELGESWVVDADCFSICTIDSPKDAREANARLIAAAPELYEALVDLARVHGNTTYPDNHPAWAAFAKADAALAKARGETQA